MAAGRVVEDEAFCSRKRMICRGFTAGSFAIAGLFQHARKKPEILWVAGDATIENQGLAFKLSQGAEPFVLRNADGLLSLSGQPSAGVLKI
jgi:hypothetical protein